jgi:hypothetical protein
MAAFLRWRKERRDLDREAVADLGIEALELARSAGTLTCDAAKRLVDRYALECGIDRAVMAALQNRDLLGVENCERVVKAARDEGAHAAAATLASALRSDALALHATAASHAS